MCVCVCVCVCIVILTLGKLYNFIEICVRYFDNSIMRNCEFVLYSLTRTEKNSVALVRERTVPTERPPLVGEVSANFCG
jgi:hypothetical protein